MDLPISSLTGSDAHYGFERCAGDFEGDKLVLSHLATAFNNPDATPGYQPGMQVEVSEVEPPVGSGHRHQCAQGLLMWRDIDGKLITESEEIQ
jgi:hypothetical protein